MICIENHKKSYRTLTELYPEAKIVDVTSKGDMPFVMLSPFYPHGDIPVPFSKGTYSWTVEGIWQGLKVFEDQDIDTAKFEIRDMKGIKRTVRKYGAPLGHRAGIYGKELLDYIDARKQIYLPSYRWILENKAQEAIQRLANLAMGNDLVLLDYNTNENIDDPLKPLSHASLVRDYLIEKHPDFINPRSDGIRASNAVVLPSKAKRKKKTKQKKNASEQYSLDL